MTRGVTGNRIGHTEHHWAGRINDWVTGTEVSVVALAAKRHGIIFTRPLNSSLDPDYAACSSVSFQRRNGCCVLSDELSEGGVIPVKNDYSIITEAHCCQVIRCKLSVSVPVSSDGVLKNGRTPGIVRIEQREVIRSGLAHSKRILNGVAGQSRVPPVRCETKGHPGADQQPAALRRGTHVLVGSREGLVRITRLISD